MELEGLGGREAPRCVLRWGSPASFIGQPVGVAITTGSPLFPFPWAFITTGHPPAPRWLRAPSPPTTGALPHFTKTCAGCRDRMCVYLSLVSGLSPVIQAGPPATLSHDLIRTRGAGDVTSPQPSQAAATPA